MAITRPFTYNNGTRIDNSIQIGDLAVGYPGLRYDNNPGGKTWWMGPVESGKYIIAKDVPTQNWPTPIGNIGSTRFWGSDNNNSSFLNMVNTLPARVGQTLFETIDEALTWLNLNGYWTNYIQSFDPFSSGSILRYPTPTWSSNIKGAGYALYNSTTEELYMELGGFGNSNGIITSSLYNTNGDIFEITSTAFNLPNYFPSSSNPSNTRIGSGEMYLDENQKLYINGLVGGSPSQGRIGKFDLTDSEYPVETYISYVAGGSTNQYGPIFGGDGRGVLYTHGQLNVFANYTSSLIQSGSGVVATSADDGDITHLGLNTQDQKLVILTNYGRRRLIDAVTLTVEDTKTMNSYESPALATTNIVYVEDVNTFYFRLNAKQASVVNGFVKGDGILMAVNASTNGLIKPIVLGGGDGTEYTQTSGIAYDPNRKVIWCFNTENQNSADWLLCAVSTISNEVVLKANINHSSTAYLTVDPDNDLLILTGTTIETFNLQDILPI
jgi:hypothetical protein